MNVLNEDYNIGELLKKSKDGMELKAIKDELEKVRVTLRRMADKGLPPNEFQVASNLQSACQAAQDIVEQFWAQPRT